jgi:hypothetical protein
MRRDEAERLDAVNRNTTTALIRCVGELASSYCRGQETLASKMQKMLVPVSGSHV